MLSLIQADLLKTGKRPMGWMILALSVLLVVAALLTIRFMIPAELRPEILNPYDALVMGPQFVQQSIGGLLMTVFGASLAGNEYGYDTWKNLLIRRPRRTPFIVSKWLTLVFSIGLGLLVLAAVSLAMSLGGGLLTGGGAGMSWSVCGPADAAHATREPERGGRHCADGRGDRALNGGRDYCRVRVADLRWGDGAVALDLRQRQGFALQRQ
jgi:hypothetical protein